MMIRLTRLANGLTVASDPMDSVESVSVGVYVGVGTRQERAEHNGVAHLLEHMAFKGTTTRSARDIAEQVEAVGGIMNAHTGREQTAYYVKLLRDDLPLGVDLLADILLNSVFDPDELDRERGVILQELGQVEDTPDDVIFDHFQAAAFPAQALGRPVLGTADIIRNVPRTAVIDYQRRHYGASTMVVAAAGRVDHDRLVALVERAFGPLSAAAENAHDPAQYRGGADRRDSDLEQVHVVLGYPGVAFADPDYYTASILSTLLGGGMSSRLFQEVRERRGLCYTISSFASSYLDGGIFGVYAGTGQREIAELMPVLAEELAKVGTPPPDDEVRRARAQIKAGLLMSLESTNARSDALATQLLIWGRPIPVEEIAQRIDAVGAEDIARVARRLLSGPLTLAAMGPLGRLEPNARIAERFATRIAA
jgi:predicted Zn-dependent peptidase